MSASAQLPAYGVTSVDSALRILELLRSRKLLRLSSVCAELDMAPSTAHRLLTTLQHREFACQDPGTKVYVAGPALMPPLVPVVGPTLKAITNPVLQMLSDATGETANLLALCGSEALIIDGVDRTDNVGPTSWIGISLPAHCTAAGKALLATLPASKVCAMYDSEPPVAPTPAACDSLAAILSKLELIHDAGYATSFGELDPSLAAVGVATVLCDTLPVALAVTAPPTASATASLSKCWSSCGAA